jgi:hypothetical protein
MNINLDPPLEITKTCTRFEIQITELKIFTHAKLMVYFFDASNNLITSKFLTIDGDLYAEWTTDQSLVDIVRRLVL